MERNPRISRFEARWQTLGPRRRALLASVMLSAAVAALFALLFALLPLTGCGFVFQGDSFYQHYPFLIAIGRWVRALVRNPAAAPRFNWSLGFGADMIGSLNYYGVGDPLTLLAALFSGPSTYAGYVLLIALRHILAALSFLALARGFGVRWKNAMIAAVCYAYTNYMIAWCALIHPMFANPAIHLPLMILGCEKRFRGERPWVLMLSTAWSALCGFYFFYMNSLMLLIFALARYFCAYRKQFSLGQAFLRAIGPFLLGVGLALPVLLPALMAYLDSARASLGAEGSLLFFEPGVYWQFPIGFIASNGWNNAMTVPVTAMCAVCALFSRKERPALKVCVALTALALLVPVVGLAFNGFSYVSDRWKYGGTILYMMVLAMYLPEVERGAAGRKLCLGMLAWSALLAARWLLRRAGDIHPAIIALAAALSVMGFVYLLLAKRLAGRRARTALLLAFITVNLFANSALLCLYHVTTDAIHGSAWERRSKTSLWASQTEGGRTELTNAEYSLTNATSVTGTASTAAYMSIQPRPTVDFLAALELNTSFHPTRMHGLDTRAALEAIWAVDGLTVPSDAAVATLYGFELISDNGENQYWRNALKLPAAWTLDARMSKSDWNALTAIEKQWALMQCAVTDADAAPELQPAQSARSVDWHVEACENASLGDGFIEFGERGGSITLAFDGLPDSETYLRLIGLVPVNEVEELTLSIECGEHTGLLLAVADDYQYGLRRRDFTTHLGYSAGANTRAVLRSGRAARYALESLEIVCQPMADFAGLVEARRDGIVSASPLGDVIRAEVDLPGDRLVCFSVPAVRGWSARVDGMSAPLLKNADALWMVSVPSGAHTVELVYRTPGLGTGLAAAAMCAAIAMAWGILGRRKRRAPRPLPYDPATQEPAIRRSICTGEMTAGFIDRATGVFHEYMRVDDPETFKKRLGVDEVRTIY